MRFKFKFLTLNILFASLCYQTMGQVFTPDKNGYVANPTFKKLIKSKGYQLVGGFDTIQQSPIVIAATVILNDKPVQIDHQGNILQDQRPVMVVPNKNVDSYLASEVRIDAPENNLTSKIHEEAYEQAYVGGKFGTIHKATKKAGLPAIYDGLTWFSNGRGLVKIKLNNKEGVATTSGKILLPPTYIKIGGLSDPLDPNREIIYSIYDGEKMGFLDQNFKVVVAPQYSFLTKCDQCDNKNNLMKFTIGNLFGLVNKQGKEIVPAKYLELTPLLQAGPILVATGQGSKRDYGLIDSNGKVLLEPNYLKITPRRGLIEITSHDYKKGVVSTTGKLILPAIYEEIGPFVNGFSVVRTDNKYNLVGLNGNKVFESNFDYLSRHDDIIVLKQGDKFGVMSIDGKQIVPFSFEFLQFRGSNFFYKHEGDSGLMDMKGKKIKSFNFADVRYTNDFLIVKKGGKFGVVDLDGKTIIPIIYDQLLDNYSFLRDGVAVAEKQGKRFIVDRYGNEYPYELWNNRR